MSSLRFDGEDVNGVGGSGEFDDAIAGFHGCGLTGLGIGDGDLRRDSRDADLEVALEPAVNGGGCEGAGRPRGIDGVAASGTQAGERAFGPLRRERGEDGDFTGVGLDERLCDTTGDAEVAVDLERRVGGEEIGQRVVNEQAADHLAGALGLAKARPQGGTPRPRP